MRDSRVPYGHMASDATGHIEADGSVTLIDVADDAEDEMNEHVAEPFRSLLAFPTSKIAPVEDQTERAWNQVAMLAQDFEQAAQAATNPGRCHQLHERVRACLQTLNDADDLIRARWDSLLQEGLD